MKLLLNIIGAASIAGGSIASLSYINTNSQTQPTVATVIKKAVKKAVANPTPGGINKFSYGEYTEFPLTDFNMWCEISHDTINTLVADHPKTSTDLMVFFLHTLPGFHNLVYNSSYSDLIYTKWLQQGFHVIDPVAWAAAYPKGMTYQVQYKATPKGPFGDDHCYFESIKSQQ